MLTNEAIKDIEETLGYTFKSKELLSQAFTRSSYAEEDRMHGGKGLSNEQLEFYGDSVLNYIVVTELSKTQAKADKDGNIISRSQKELSTFVSFWTNKYMLSVRMTKLCLNKYLLLSKGDIKQDVGNNKNFKEDLFEAILGAVWFDSNYDLELLTNFVYNNLKLKFDDFYFDNEKTNELTEIYKKLVEEVNPYITVDNCKRDGTLDLEMEDVEEGMTIITKISPELTGLVSKMMAGKTQVEYLETESEISKLKKKIDPEKVTEANSIQKLLQLFQLKIIKVKPIQEEEFQYEKGLWFAKVELGDGSTFVSSRKNKQEAKNEAALAAFKYAYDRAGNATKDGKLIEL